MLASPEVEQIPGVGRSETGSGALASSEYQRFYHGWLILIRLASLFLGLSPGNRKITFLCSWKLVLGKTSYFIPVTMELKTFFVGSCSSSGPVSTLELSQCPKAHNVLIGLTLCS